MPNYGEDVAEGITIFKDQKTNKVIEFRKRTRSLKDIELNLPFKVNFFALV